MGDFVIYFNTTVNVGSLLFVDALDAAHSIARFANIDSLGGPAGRQLRRRRLPLRLRTPRTALSGVPRDRGARHIHDWRTGNGSWKHNHRNR